VRSFHADIAPVFALPCSCSAVAAGSVGILHCLDREESLQELFMGHELAHEAQQQPAPPLVDVQRIVVDRTAADSLDVILMAAPLPALAH
jgi:hypothetical protein